MFRNFRERESDARMRSILFIAQALFASAVFAVELPALPPSEYADTEVSTNFVFAVGEGGCVM